jgi:hypothetical protein
VTLVEAATKRKPYKRTIERFWRQPHHANVFSQEDLLATDWECEGDVPYYPVTEPELAQAFALGFRSDGGDFKRFVANVVCRGKVIV